MAEKSCAGAGGVRDRSLRAHGEGVQCAKRPRRRQLLAGPCPAPSSAPAPTTPAVAPPNKYGSSAGARLVDFTPLKASWRGLLFKQTAALLSANRHVGGAALLDMTSGKRREKL